MIYRARTPQFLLAKPVIDLFAKAYEKHPCMTADQAIKLLLPVIGAPTTGVFIGEEKAELKALGIVMLPTTPILQTAEAQDFYSGGSARLRKDLLTEMVGFVKQSGYNKVWLINQSGNPDKAMSRLVQGLASCRPVGSILELDLK